jgi:glutamyl-Q tRNA(Asp) synthetase
VSSLAAQLAQLPPGLRTRFAPSPTGFLHRGHVASAIFVWGIARRVGAKVILRLEDHDQTRYRSVFAESIYEDLEWLGLIPDFGLDPKERKSYQQSQHPERYAEAEKSLNSATYLCACSRREIVERTGESEGREELRYDNHCRNLSIGADAKAGRRVRLDSASEAFTDLLLGRQEQCPMMQCGDLLIRDRDKNWTYNFAVVVDDLVEDIGLVIRGQDILHATGRQIKLRRMLDPKAPPLHVLHHPLIWESPGKKLSKRDGSMAIAALRAAGKRPEDVLGEAAFAVGLLPKVTALSFGEIVGLF